MIRGIMSIVGTRYALGFDCSAQRVEEGISSEVVDRREVLHGPDFEQ